MTPTEAVALCRLAKAACPQQAFDEYTPDAWGEILGHLEFADCKAALFKLAGDRPFVAPAEIKSEVRRVRHERLIAFGPIEPPRHVDPGDVAGYMQWHYEQTKAVCDGSLTRDMLPDPEPEPPSITKAMRELRIKAAEHARDGLGRPVMPTRRPLRDHAVLEARLAATTTDDHKAATARAGLADESEERA